MQTAEDYWYENCFNTDEGYVLNKEDFFKYASQLHPPPTPSKELKSAAKVITEQIGIRLDAPKQTPMDKGECIVCMEAYASQLHPSPTPAEDGKQGGEVGMSVEDVLADIILIRNKLHEDLPTGEMNAFELLQTIKWHINELDNYCTTLSTLKSQPSTPVQKL